MRKEKKKKDMEGKINQNTSQKKRKEKNKKNKRKKEEEKVYLANIIKGLDFRTRGKMGFSHSHSSVPSIHDHQRLRKLSVYGNFRTNNPSWSSQFKDKSFLV